VSQPTYPCSRHDRPHARLYDHWMQHPAWRTLSPPAFKIISLLLASYRPANPNAFPVGQRRMADMCGCAPNTAKKAIDELIEGGFLREERRGRSRGNAASRERVASLTRYDSDTHIGDPDLPIKTWKQRKKFGGLKSAA
jgi:DNA-binding MarR family transcriptional regulator